MTNEHKSAETVPKCVECGVPVGIGETHCWNCHADTTDEYRESQQDEEELMVRAEEIRDDLRESGCRLYNPLYTTCDCPKH